jgi:hypothetical protein
MDLRERRGQWAVCKCSRSGTPLGKGPNKAQSRWVGSRRRCEHQPNRMAIHLLDPSSSTRVHFDWTLHSLLAKEKNRLSEDEFQAVDLGV